MFCPNRARHNGRFYEAAGTDRYEKMMSAGWGLRGVARWTMSEGLRGEFSLAKEQSDWNRGEGIG